MLISVTAKEFDVAGAVLLDVPSPDFGETRRRATRVATLDGGAVVNDNGYTDSDRRMSFSWRPTAAEETTLRRLVRYHDRVRVSTPLGLMEGIIQAFTVTAGAATLIVLPVTRLSE